MTAPTQKGRLLRCSSGFSVTAPHCISFGNTNWTKVVLCPAKKACTQWATGIPMNHVVVDVLTPVGRVSHTAQAQLSEWWAHTVGVILNL